MGFDSPLLEKKNQINSNELIIKYKIGKGFDSPLLERKTQMNSIEFGRVKISV